MKKFLYVSFALMILLGLSGLSGAMMMDGRGKGSMDCMKNMEMKKGAGMGMAGMGMGDEMPMMGRMMSLDLNDKQKEDIRTIHLKVKKEFIKKKADIEISEIELKEILMKDPVDIKAAETKIKQIESLKSEIKILHIKAKEETKTKLTPEQRKKFNSNMQMHQMGKGMGMMGRCGMNCMDQMDEEGDEDSNDSSSPEPMQHHQ